MSMFIKYTRIRSLPYILPSFEFLMKPNIAKRAPEPKRNTTLTELPITDLSNARSISPQYSHSEENLVLNPLNENSVFDPKNLKSKVRVRVFDEKIEEIKAIFFKISTQDTLDMQAYHALDSNQLQIVNEIFHKRYEPDIFKAIEQCKQDQLCVYDYLIKKRMDHCEKSSLSLRLAILRTQFTLPEDSNIQAANKDISDNVNNRLFKYYFDHWINPERMMEITKGVHSGDDEKMTPVILPRKNAIFCVRKGLTKGWFKSISTKFLNHLITISCELLKIYYFERFQVKLDEIFGDDNPTDMETYCEKMKAKIRDKKFKLPLTSKELEYCDLKAFKKIKKLRKYTDESEYREFKEHYGDQEFAERYQSWLKVEPCFKLDAHR